MKRRLFNLLSAVSLVLGVATCMLWVRSYWAGDAWSINLPQFGRPLADETLDVVSGRGGIRVSFQRRARWEFRVMKPTRTAMPAATISYRHLVPFYPYALNAAIFQRLGCELSSHSEPMEPTSVGEAIVREVNVVMPCPLVAATAGVMPCLWWRRRQKTLASRRQSGFCPTCGYDLRTSPGRCPECGTVAVKASL